MFVSVLVDAVAADCAFCNKPNETGNGELFNDNLILVKLTRFEILN